MKRLDGVWKNKHYGLLVWLCEIGLHHRSRIGGVGSFAAMMWILEGGATDVKLRYSFLVPVLPSQPVKIQILAVCQVDRARYVGDPTFVGTIWDIEGVAFLRYANVLHRPR